MCRTIVRKIDISLHHIQLANFRYGKNANIFSTTKICSAEVHMAVFGPPPLADTDGFGTQQELVRASDEEHYV